MADGKYPWQTDAAIGILLATVTVVTYWPVLDCGFINLDDAKYASANPEVAAGLSLHSMAYAWTTFDLGNWIPLTWLSLELDASLFGIRAPAFHATNLLWHTANVVLLFYVLLRMTGARGPSVAAALLFALHPLHVESVAWISERKDVLSTAGLLVTLLAYDWYARSPSAGRLAVVCLAMTLGLLAKPMLVTLPVLLLLLDVWPLRRAAIRPARSESDTPYTTRTWRQLVVEKAPLFALSLADGIVTIIAQRSANAMSGTDNVPLFHRVANAIEGYGWYLWKTIIPTGLCLLYPFEPLEISWPMVIVSALVLAGLSLLVFVGGGRGHLIFGWLWFLVALLPVCGLLQVGGQAHADRYVYIPHIGLFVAMVWEVGYWLARRGPAPWVAGACLAAVALPCALLTRGQVATWRGSESVWSHALELDPDNFAAHATLGILRLQEHDLEAAERHLQRVLARRPEFRGVLDHLARICEERGQWQEAAEYYAWALRVNPQDQVAADSLAALRSSGKLLATGTPERPSSAGEAAEQNRRGLANARQGKMEAALRHFQEALALEPEYAEAHNNAGLALKELKRLAEARGHLQRALASAPDNADFHVNLASILVAEGAFAEACEEYEIALKLRPQDVDARFRLEQLRKRPRAP
jgi:Flp pilus assembly protein TadD